MATRRDFETIADHLAKSWPPKSDEVDEQDDEYIQGYKRAINAVCRGLQYCNGTFNEDRFRQRIQSKRKK